MSIITIPVTYTASTRLMSVSNDTIAAGTSGDDCTTEIVFTFSGSIGTYVPFCVFSSRSVNDEHIVYNHEYELDHTTNKVLVPNEVMAGCENGTLMMQLHFIDSSTSKGFYSFNMVEMKVYRAIQDSEIHEQPVPGLSIFALRTELVAEQTARATADNTLQNNIDAEASTRAANDATLQSSISSEASARQSADATLQTNISAETSARQAADTALQTNINNEASARSTKDTELQVAINSEATARAAADEALSDRITVNTNAIAAEVTRATAKEADLQNQIDAKQPAGSYATTAQLNAEISERQAGDTAETNARAAAIAQEVTDRNTAIGNAISAEVTNRNTAISNAISAEVTARNTAITSAVNTHNSANDAHLDIRNLVAAKVNKPSAEGISGQILATNGNGTTYWKSDSMREIADSWNSPETRTGVAPSARLVKSSLDDKANSSDIPTKTSDLMNDSGFITSSAVPTKTSQLTNDSGYITSASVPTALSQLTEDSTHRLVTDTEKTTWNNKQSAIGYTPENQGNKVASISASSTDTQYPSAKCVYDIVGDIEAALDEIRGV